MAFPTPSRKVYVHAAEERCVDEEELQSRVAFCGVPTEITTQAELAQWLKTKHGAVDVLQTTHGWMQIPEDGAASPLPSTFVCHVRKSAGTSDSLGFHKSNKIISILKELWKRVKAFKLEQLEGFVEIPEWKMLSSLSINVPDRKALYVRECFSDFYRKLMDAFQAHKFVHVNGTPGIGKSAFLWYVVLRAAIACEFDVIVELGHGKSATSAGIAFYRNGSVDYSPTFTSLDICGDGPFLHLIDQLFLGNHFGRNIIIFASPDEDNTKGALKCGGGSLCRKVMPSWRKELNGFLQLCLRELPNFKLEEILEQISLWGIIPRVVFDRMEEPAYLDEVIAKCNLELCKWWVGKYVQVMDKSLPCKIFELEPIDGEYEIGSVRFASKRMGVRFWQHFWNKERQKLAAFLTSSAGMVELSVLRGFIYENCLIGSWSDTRAVGLHARSLKDGSQLCFDVGQRSVRHFSDPLEIRAAHAAGDDLTKFLWVPRKNNPLYDLLVFPHLIVQVTVADGETSGHDVLQMALINTSTLMWDLNNKQKVIFLVAVPTDEVTKWKSSSLKWKKANGGELQANGGELQKFRTVLDKIGLYVAGYDPFGQDSENDGKVLAGLNANDSADLEKFLPMVKQNAQDSVRQKRKASSLVALSDMGSKSTAKLEAMWPHDSDEDDDMAEHSLNEAERSRAV